MFCVWRRNIQNLALYSFSTLTRWRTALLVGSVLDVTLTLSPSIILWLVFITCLWMLSVPLSATKQCLISISRQPLWSQKVSCYFWIMKATRGHFHWLKPPFPKCILFIDICVLLRGSWLFYNIRFVGLDSVQWDNSVCEFLLYAQHVSESLKYTNDQTSDLIFNIS
jgi:hypothetical protein